MTLLFILLAAAGVICFYAFTGIPEILSFAAFLKDHRYYAAGAAALILILTVLYTVLAPGMRFRARRKRILRQLSQSK